MKAVSFESIPLKIDFKLDYMARMFRKISHKRFETYIIQRIWHRLDDDRVQFVTQQYVKRKIDDRYALADLYLPQVGIVVEINEPFHYGEIKRELDSVRAVEIKMVTDATIFEIDCRKSMAEIHQDIEAVVAEIRKRIKQQGEHFLPWLGLAARTPDYYQRKGYFAVGDNEYMETIDDICEAFGTRARHRGFLRAGEAYVDENSILWFPNVENKKWHNEFLEDEATILEYPEDLSDRKRHMLKHTTDPERRRITFFRQKDDLGFNYYKFVGVFMIDVRQSQKECRCVWKRITDRYELNSKM